MGCSLLTSTLVPVAPTVPQSRSSAKSVLASVSTPKRLHLTPVCKTSRRRTTGCSSSTSTSLLRFREATVSRLCSPRCPNFLPFVLGEQRLYHLLPIFLRT